jgi:hypothetical protein
MQPWILYRFQAVCSEKYPMPVSVSCLSYLVGFNAGFETQVCEGLVNAMGCVFPITER